jgi:hypothetical protein
MHSCKSQDKQPRLDIDKAYSYRSHQNRSRQSCKLHWDKVDWTSFKKAILPDFETLWSDTEQSIAVSMLLEQEHIECRGHFTRAARQQAYNMVAEELRRQKYSRSWKAVKEFWEAHEERDTRFDGEWEAKPHPPPKSPSTRKKHANSKQPRAGNNLQRPSTRPHDYHSDSDSSNLFVGRAPPQLLPKSHQDNAELQQSPTRSLSPSEPADLIRSIGEGTSQQQSIQASEPSSIHDMLPKAILWPSPPNRSPREHIEEERAPASLRARPTASIGETRLQRTSDRLISESAASIGPLLNAAKSAFRSIQSAMNTQQGPGHSSTSSERSRSSGAADRSCQRLGASES